MKHIKLFEAFIAEGIKAPKALEEIVKGNTSRAEGIKISKELAQHYLDWLRTSPWGKKQGYDLPLHMVIKASFNWGIERGLDPKLKPELDALKSSIKGSLTESKAFDRDVERLIKDVKSGYGWIDPEFVEDTWDNVSDTIDFELVSTEIYKRLIKAGLLWTSEDGEEKDKQIKSLKELGIKESVNEAVFSEFSNSELADIEKDWEHGSAIKAINAISKKLHGKDITKLNLSKQSQDEFDELYNNYLSGGRKKAATTLIAIYKLLKESFLDEYQPGDWNEDEVTEGEKLVYDELGSTIDELRDKISNLMKITTDKKWTTALGQALTAVSNLDRNLSQADSRLGAIPIGESVMEATLDITGHAYNMWNDKKVQRELRDVNIKIVGDIKGVMTISGDEKELDKVRAIFGIKESAGLSKDETMKVAQLYAKAISKADGTKCTVNLKTLEPGSFDLDCDGIEYDGGSYYIDTNGDVINAAISGKPVYGKWNDTVDVIVRNVKKL